ncbi:hypothetical protein KY284_021739 [Solanum tuberosum]|nr:hypothetical protein KY284_021739 [Solanum tuberosum]
MDFTEGLPKSRSKDVILVEVDMQLKYAYFVAISHPFNAATVAHKFWKKMHCLHGTPKSISLFKLLGTQLHFSTAYYPQIDGQAKRVNRCIENYLRCMISNMPTHQRQWLPSAEWQYKTNFHTGLHGTPFEALYGYSPPHLSFWTPDNLHKAQERMKLYADKMRLDKECSRWSILGETSCYPGETNGEALLYGHGEGAHLVV